MRGNAVFLRTCYRIIIDQNHFDFLFCAVQIGYPNGFLSFSLHGGLPECASEQGNVLVPVVVYHSIKQINITIIK
jgi:hypothetical protein